MVTRQIRRNLDHKLSGHVSVNLGYLSSDYKLLILNIEKAKNLLKGDLFGLSDPYIRVRFRGTDENSLISLSPSTTPTVKRTLSPSWYHKFYYLVSAPQFTIILDVFDENILTRDDHLGRVMLHFSFTGNDHVLVQQPHVFVTEGWVPELSTRLDSLPIRSKYSRSFVQELDLLMDMQHIADLRSEFAEKSVRHSTMQGSGYLNLSYAFLKPDLPEAIRLMEQTGARVIQRMRITHSHRHDNDDNETSVSSQSLPYPTQSNFPQTTPTQDSLTSSIPLGFEIIEAPPTSSEQNSREQEQEDSDEEDTPLPEGWEERVDSNGRRVYINHLSRSTSLRRPVRATVSPRPRNFLPRLDSVEVIENLEEEEEETVQEQPPAHTSGSTLESHDATFPTAPVPSAPPIPTLEVAMPEERSSRETSPRGDQVVPSRPEMTPQERKGARLREGLPPGWDVAFTQDGQTYYVDHIHKKTSWDRPKMMERKPVREERGAQPNPVEQDPELPSGWEARKTAQGEVYYVNHNAKTTQWEHPLKKTTSLGPLPTGWEMKQMKDGTIFFIDHTTKSTQWEDPRLQAKNKPTHRMQYSRDYKQKYSNFIQNLKPKHTIPNQFSLPVKRSNILEDSFNKIIIVRDPEVLKARLWVDFDGERGLDYGGLSREWFHLLSREMFNPYYGLFEYSASDDYTLQINPDSGIYNETHLEYFKFIGRVCGMAIYHKKLIDAFFIRPFYKMILKRPITLKDMESVDVELYNSVQYIMDNDPEPLCLTFAVNKTVFGELLEEELKPGGQDISVTEENKKEYIDLLIKWRFTKRVEKQMDAFLEGLSSIIPLRQLRVFDERELEYLLGGLAQIDVKDWKTNTELIGYTRNDRVIIWFWKAVENYDDEMRARLLQFVTGTSKVPMNGFAELQGSNGPKKFCIKKTGLSNELPIAHTCFNRLDLPPYESYHRLKENLQLAVENTEGFEVE